MSGSLIQKIPTESFAFKTINDVSNYSDVLNLKPRLKDLAWQPVQRTAGSLENGRFQLITVFTVGPQQYSIFLV